NEKTKAIIICNPNNPTGKVFSTEELEFIADLCKEYDALAFTDEIYEHILYGPPAASRPVASDASIPEKSGGQDVRVPAHICMANIPGMRERTVVVNSLS